MKTAKGFLILPARKLLTPYRLDLVVKWRFFRHLLHQDDPDSEPVYRWHIQKRTGGREKGSWKRTIDDYVSACPTLLRSMQNRGFDPAFPIRRGTNGFLFSGAHRISCALLLGLAVHVRQFGTCRSALWDRDWFVRKGLSEKKLARIEADFHQLTHSHDQAA